MKKTNKQLRAVIITSHGFEDEELIYPAIRLGEDGFVVDIATPGAEVVKSNRGFPFPVLIKYFATLVDAKKLGTGYDLIVIPGGCEAPDRLRQVPEVLEYLRAADKQGTVIASICHGPWVLISAKIIKGRKVTCYIGMRDDLINAGAVYSDEAVVIDKNLITSRHPRDLGAFMQAIISRFKK